MNKYEEVKAELTKKHNEFPFIWAFSNDQLAEGLKKLGLGPDDTNKLYSIGSGGYIRKSDSKKLQELLDNHDETIKEALKDNEYLYQGFLYELGNHEFCITYDPEPAIEAVGLTLKEVEADERILNLFTKARKDYLTSYRQWEEEQEEDEY